MAGTETDRIVMHLRALTSNQLGHVMGAPEEIAARMERTAQQFVELDTHLAAGGELPRYWRNAPGALPPVRPIVKENGRVTFTPWTDGFALGYEVRHTDGRVEYIYLNPSPDGDGEDDENIGTVFVYTGPNGDPAHDAPACYLDALTGERADVEPVAALIKKVEAAGVDMLQLHDHLQSVVDLAGRRLSDDSMDDLTHLVAGFLADHPRRQQPSRAAAIAEFETTVHRLTGFDSHAVVADALAAQRPDTETKEH